MATIFFSHSSRDDALASTVEAWLKRQGFDDIFVDHDLIRAGDKWTETLRRASGSCRVVLCLVTPDWLASSDCFGEFTAGWYLGRRMIPLVCGPDAKLDDTQKKRLARVLLEDQGVDILQAGAPLALNLDAHPEVATPLIEGLRAAGALARVGLDPSVFSVDDRRDPEGNLLKPPFPGLESFGDTDADAAIFYGRSSEIAQVLEDLREFRANGDRRAYAHAGRAYVIQGASGSGKSSLLKAGVLPRLRRERGWLALRCFRPGADPLLHFAEALAKPFEGRSTYQAQGVIRDRLLEHWRNARSNAKGSRGSVANDSPAEVRRAALNEIDLAMLHTLRHQLDAEITPLKLQLDRPAATVLIAIDQGEELARAEGDSGDALADYLRAALLPAPEDQPAQYAAVLTLRTDSFEELQTSPRFEGLATRLFDLRPLPTYRFDAAIEQPACRYGVEIEPQLVDVLMDDAGGKDALPLLAFTLQRLWRQYEVERRIRKANYESLGKLPSLIEDAAERALRGIDPGAQQGPLSGNISKSRDRLGQGVFVPALAQVNEQGGTIRRVATLSSFDDERREMLASFEKWRLVVTSGTDVEVVHEALFGAWPRFSRWLEPERARLETLRALESAAASWDSHGRRYDFIGHIGRRLRDAQNLMKVADFRNHINRDSKLRDYLRAAEYAGRGWRIATWFTLAYFSIATIFLAAGTFTAYAIGDYRLLPWVFFCTLPAIFVCTPVTACLAYLGAVLRQKVLRSWFYSDIVVLSLAGIFGVAFGIAVPLFGFVVGHMSGNMGEALRLIAETQKDTAFGQGVDPTTIGLAIWVGLFLLVLMLAPLPWVTLQLLWLARLPLSFLARTFAGATDNIDGFISFSSAREETALKRATDGQREWVRSRNIALGAATFLAVLATLLGFALWRKVPNQSDSMYSFGVSSAGKHDYVKAREWYEKAADKGNAMAMNNLGWIYENGHGVARDYDKARELYQKAADKGNAVAVNNLGWIYANGHGVAQDHVKARELYEKAADKGNDFAMNNLGRLYENGLGVTRDYDKARELYQKAADKGNAVAVNNLGWIYANGHGVAQDHVKARELYEKAADKGNDFAMYNLGTVYENGLGVTRDYDKARELYQKAADKGNDLAMNSLGRLYGNGHGVVQDYGKAREWYQKAADKGNAVAMNNLGRVYENGQGHGVAQDYDKAREWYEKAADKGDADAKANLEKLPISKAAAAGRYAEALRLQEALAVKEEAVETEREGKPGKETAQALMAVARYALFAREFTKALTAVERAHALLPEDLLVETNRAHALMFMELGKECEALYLAHKGEPASEQDGELWERTIAEDFVKFRKAGLVHPMMADIEKELGVSR